MGARGFGHSRHSSRVAAAEYYLPALWDCWGYAGPRKRRGAEVIVDPGAYLRACLAWIDARAVVTGRIAGRSLSQALGVRGAGKLKVRADGGTRRGGDWIRRQVLYGMIVRASTAWDHDGDGRLSSRRFNEMGTFLKSILLLPHLHRMGVTCLYLLPVVKVSRLYRKGELGCPYSAKDFFALDPVLADEAFGGGYGEVDGQFRLLVTCAHRLGMRVMLDVAPRTAARDSDWILENPEWFYWIARRYERGYAAPQIPGATYLNPVSGRLGEIYDVPAVRAHLAKFRFAPSVTQPQKWANFARVARARPPANLLREIAAHFGVVTPPGFSDVVNDRQPPWSDVTYLRLFADHPAEAVRHLPDPSVQPPYVLYDSAKASLFPGRRPMRALWNRLANIIPHYQRFGVDGARVDMAHALPKSLEAAILERPRRRDPDFCFCAEELGTGNHAKACAAGYNIIIGPSWWMQPRGHEGRMHELVRELPNLATPVMAAAETPDTPRAVVRKGGKRFSRQAVVVNCFLPNAAPMINGGMEVFERQPLNLGLDAKPGDRFALAKRDPLYGKLAFFDRFALHWGNGGAKAMIELIAAATRLRAEYLECLTDPRAYFAPKLTMNAKSVLATGYRLPGGRGALVMLANCDPEKRRRVAIRGLMATRAVGGGRRGGAAPEVLLRSGEEAESGRAGRTESVVLGPSEAVVLRMGGRS